MRMVRCLALAHALLLAYWAGLANAQDRGYWVVTATLRAESLAQISGISASVEQCGYPSFADSSAKFVGFAPGYTAIVVGPFIEQKNADLARERIKPCIPDVYVKHGAYLGQ